MGHVSRAVLVVATVGIEAVLPVDIAHAAVPATYTGMPAFGGQTCDSTGCKRALQGTPTAIPGRLEFENVDLGGYGVAFKVDHYDNAVSGADYRPGEKIPNVCCLNCKGVVDKYADGGIYPSSANPHGYYVGWAHPVDWTKFTINVQQAGAYKVTTTFASQPNAIQISLWFNDVRKIPDASSATPYLKLAGTNDYHIWQYYELGTIQLDAGLQVMQFKLEGQPHIQYDYLQFDLIGADGGSVTTGGNADGGDNVDGGSTSAVDSGGGGTASSGGTVGATDASLPFDEPLDGGDAASSGATGSSTGGHVASPGSSPAGSSGCSCSAARSATRDASAGAASVALLALGFYRRRRRGRNVN